MSRRSNEPPVGAPQDAAVTPALEIRGLTKRYGQTIAVNRLDLTIPRGTVLGLLGPNGAGKSTTLRMVMGLLRPTEGDIRVLGLDVFGHPTQVRQRVGYVPETPQIYRWMTVREVMRFCRALYVGWNDEQARFLLDSFALPDSRRVRQLSRGMLAKLSLAVALAHQPELLILDEPLSGLDPLARDEFLDGVLQGLCDGDRTVVFSSHQLDDVNRLSDSVAVLNAGSVVTHCSLDDLRAAKRVRAVLHDGRLPVQAPPETIWQSVNRREWTLTLHPYSPGALDRLTASNPVNAVEISDLSLDEIFKDLIRGQAGRKQEATLSC
jgi:ABC-2 type transport system ATP-binding protein